MKCAACGKFIASNGAANCSVCPAFYHKECVSLSVTAPVSNEWACPECKKKVRKCDNTPVRAVHDASVAGPAPRRAAQRAVAAAMTVAAAATTIPLAIDTAAPGLDVQDLRLELAELVVELREFRREMVEFRSSVDGITARMENIEQRLDAVERRRNESADVTELEHTVTQLKLELNDRDQEALLTDLEIGHLPEERGENVLHAVIVLGAKLGVALEERDVVFAERVGVALVAGTAGEVPRERRVVVRLVRRHLRDQLLQAARVRRTLTAADAGREASQRRIFINERLTRVNRQLFHRVREECRKLQWRYSWTKRGRIYARQSDGKAAHLIRSETDLNRIFGTGSV